MSWERIAHQTIELVWGGRAQTDVRELGRGRVLVQVTWPAEGEEPVVLALGGGASADEAWRMVVAVIARNEGRLSTPEVARVLGVSPSRVRQFVMEGRLQPLAARRGGEFARFAPGEVLRFAAVPRRQGTRGSVAD